MLGNLVASLIAAESLVTTEAKAKALRPVAEKCITAAVKGGVHRHRNVIALLQPAGDFSLVANDAAGGHLARAHHALLDDEHARDARIAQNGGGRYEQCAIVAEVHRHVREESRL